MKQIQQYDDQFFQEMLIKIRIGLFNNINIVIFNSKVIIIIPIQNILENIIIVQQNIIPHMINKF